MGTEDWILKSTELITNTKKQKLKIWHRGQTLKNTILKKQNRIAKVIIYIYIYRQIDIKLKNRVYFLAS